MAVAPNNYHKVRTSVVYESPTHGKLTIYRDADVVCVNWQAWIDGFGGVATIGAAANPVSTPVDRKNLEIWRGGEFNKDNIAEVARCCSDDAETMQHWIEEEAMQFISKFVPEPEEQPT